MVSVIIPIYNVEKYLRECVDSIISQTCTDLEIILVDDGSPDNCGAICDEYAAKDSRVKVIHKPNGGLSDARNAGTDAASGEYVLFLDSDDYLKRDAVEKLVSRIEAENADLVYFDAETLFEDFEDPDYIEEFIRKRAYRSCAGARVLGAHLKNKDYYSCACLYLLRKSFIDENSLRFYKGIIHEDELYTVIAFVRARKVAQLREALYVRRLRAGSIMSGRNSVRSIECCRIIINNYFREAKKYSRGSVENKVLDLYICNLLILIIYKYSALDRSDRKKALPVIRQLRQKLAETGCFGSKKIRIMYCHPDLFSFYINWLKPVRDRLTKTKT